MPVLDQNGFALWDANLVWRSSNGRYEIGLHGEEFGEQEVYLSGYNFLRQNPSTGAFILNDAAGTPGLNSTLGLEGCCPPSTARRGRCSCPSG